MSLKGIPNRSHQRKRRAVDMDWQRQAACVDYDPEIFFDPERVPEALTICARCDVREACDDYAIANREPCGVWGGRVRASKAQGGLQTFLLQPCGTEAAYRRHKRHGERPCRTCLDGYAAIKRVTQPGGHR